MARRRERRVALDLRCWNAARAGLVHEPARQSPAGRARSAARAGQHLQRQLRDRLGRSRVTGGAPGERHHRARSGRTRRADGERALGSGRSRQCGKESVARNRHGDFAFRPRSHRTRRGLFTSRVEEQHTDNRRSVHAHALEIREHRWTFQAEAENLVSGDRGRAHLRSHGAGRRAHSGDGAGQGAWLGAGSRRSDHRGRGTVLGDRARARRRRRARRRQRARARAGRCLDVVRRLLRGRSARNRGARRRSTAKHHAGRAARRASQHAGAVGRVSTAERCRRARRSRRYRALDANTGQAVHRSWLNRQQRRAPAQ